MRRWFRLVERRDIVLLLWLVFAIGCGNAAELAAKKKPKKAKAAAAAPAEKPDDPDDDEVEEYKKPFPKELVGSWVLISRIDGKEVTEVMVVKPDGEAVFAGAGFSQGGKLEDMGFDDIGGQVWLKQNGTVVRQIAIVKQPTGAFYHTIDPSIGNITSQKYRGFMVRVAGGE